MASVAELLVNVVVKADDVAGQFDKAGAGAAKFQKGLAIASVAAGAAIVAVAGFAKQAVDAASRTEQAFGGLGAVFGTNAGQMEDWANGAAESMGLSSAAYAEGAAKIGAQMKNLGVPMDQIAGKTNDLMTVAADLAATYGGTTAEAVDALSAALRGEADPAERYGLALNQTALNAQMAADGTDKLTGKAKQQAKVTTLLGMVTEQAGGALGQFARESDTAAGSSQIAAAQWDNAKSALGEALLPVVTQAATAFAKFAKFAQENATLFQVLIGVILALSVAVLLLAAAQWVMNSALLAFPGTWIALAIIAVIAAIVILWMKCEGFRNAVLAVWNAIKVGLTALGIAAKAVAAWFVSAWAAVVGAFNTVKAAVMSVAAAVTGFFIAAWQTAQAVVAAVINFIKALIMSVVATVVFIASAIVAPWRWAFGLVKAIAELAFVAVRLAFQLLVAGLLILINKIVAGFRSAWALVKSITASVVSAIKAYFAPLVSFISNVVNRIKSAFQAGMNAIKSVAAAATSWVKAKFAALTAPVVAVVNRIKAAFTAALNAIKSAVSSATSVIKSKFAALAAPIVAVANKIKSGFVSALNAIKSAASAAGRAVSSAFSGIKGVIDGIIGAVRRLTSALRNIKVPHISLPKLGGASRTAAIAPSAMSLRAGTSPRLRAGYLGASSTAGAVVVNVNGALDPEGVARQIERILSAGARRRTGVTLRQRADGKAAAA